MSILCAIHLLIFCLVAPIVMNDLTLATPVERHSPIPVYWRCTTKRTQARSRTLADCATNVLRGIITWWPICKHNSTLTIPVELPICSLSKPAVSVRDNYTCKPIWKSRILAKLYTIISVFFYFKLRIALFPSSLQVYNLYMLYKNAERMNMESALES